MKKGRRSYDEASRQRLLALWDGEDGFGEPIGCLATTYTFQADFFEEQCLGRFVRMDTSSAEDGRTYLIEHETKLSQVFACVLVDTKQVSGNRSLRWHLLPVRVPGAIQHAKVSLLFWENCVRLMVGSANLTVPGYRSNFEHMAALDFKQDGGPPRSLLIEAIAFIRSIQGLSPGAGQTLGPHRGLSEFLQGLEDKTKDWRSEEWRRGEPRCSFMWTGPERPSLFDILAKAWTGPPATYARVVSPFYDLGERACETTSALERDLLISRGNRLIHFISPGRLAPDGAVEVDLPEALKNTSHPSVTHQFAYVPELQGEEENEERRALHAKSLWVERDGRVLYAMGSSNFTMNGTGLARSPNIEANLLYDIPDASNEFGKLCLAATPPFLNMVEGKQVLRFLHDVPLQDQTDDGCEFVPLPSCFEAALFFPQEGGGMLQLEFRAPPPLGLTLTSGDISLSDRFTIGPTFPCVLTIPWTHPKPPSSLEVTWPNEGEIRRAIWVVNVTDTAALAPPVEWRQLKLEELLQILTSALPLHLAVARLIKSREESKGMVKQSAVIDPHKKVDTTQFLLRRMKRLSMALEGLRERMQRTVFSRDALRWRLRGPLGPLALAQRLLNEEKEAAGFMISEIAATLKDSKPTFATGVDQTDAEKEIDMVITELVDLTRRNPAPENLASYVDETCKEILS